MKLNILPFLLLFTVFCTKNQGLKNESLISLADANRDYTHILFLKSVEYFGSRAVYSPISFEKVEKCKRQSFYDKSDFRSCMRQITLYKFSAKDPLELRYQLDDFVFNVCKVKRRILFDNSVDGGELNLCELN